MLLKFAYFGRGSKIDSMVVTVGCLRQCNTDMDELRKALTSRQAEMKWTTEIPEIWGFSGLTEATASHFQ